MASARATLYSDVAVVASYDMGAAMAEWAQDQYRVQLTAAAAEMDAGVDPIAAGPGVVYWNPVKGTTVDTPFAKLLAKTAYKPRTTNRNLRTLRRILG